MMEVEERREWHKNNREDEYTKRLKHIVYCQNNKLVYKNNYELVMGESFKEHYYKKADVLKMPRHNGGHLNGKKIL